MSTHPASAGQPPLTHLRAGDNPDSIGIAYRVAQGPRDELQDLPFRIRLAYHRGEYAAFDVAAVRDPGDTERDLFVFGVLDGIGGSALSIDPERLRALNPIFDYREWVSRSFRRRPGFYLTGRAASHYLLASIKRHACKLDLDSSKYGVAELLQETHRDLFELNQILLRFEIAEPEGSTPIGAAISIAIVDRGGRLQYANSGDCRAVVIRHASGDWTAEELSVKQTLGTAMRTEPGTSIGTPGDRIIYNALGVRPVSLPHTRTDLTLARHDVLLQMTDGTREALMHAPELQEIPWDQRDLATAVARVVVPHLTVGGRMYPFVHTLFEGHVLPFVGDASTTRGATGTVFDNVALLAATPTPPVQAAMDQLFQGVLEGDVEISKDPYAIDRAVLDHAARSAGLTSAEELAQFVTDVEAAGLAVHGPSV